VYKNAAIGLGVNYHKWGYFSGLKAVDILKGQNVTNPIEPITETELIINKKACAEQGLIVPQSLVDRATNLLE
jgi:putative ABC transport system substrate-binding protein